MSIKEHAPDAVSFRAAVGSFAASVCVITVRDESGRPWGMTATAFCSVSMDPFLVLVCVDNASKTHRRVLRGGSFGINILAEDGGEVSEFCARPGLDKFLPDEWLATARRAWSAPAIADSLAFLDCEVYRRFPAGTHGVLIGRVVGIGLQERDNERGPLVHFRGSSHALAQLSGEPTVAVGQVLRLEQIGLQYGARVDGRKGGRG